MDPARTVFWGVAVAILGGLLLTSPAIGLLDVTDEPARLGGGNATVTDVTLVDGPAIDAGRFGTNRTYLRGPTAAATVGSVTDDPRLVLRLEAPALSVDAATTRVLDSDATGRVRLSLSDRPIALAPVDDGTVTVRTTVRVQSFRTDRVILAENRTLEVRG